MKKQIIIPVVILLILGIFSYLLFYKTDYKEYSNKQSFQSLIKTILKTSSDGTIILDEDTINSLTSTYLRSKVNNSGVSVLGFNIDISEDAAKFTIPIKYKKFTLYLSSQGEFKINGEYLVYTPNYFKIGKIPIPKSKILSIIKNKFKTKLTIKDNSIFIKRALSSNKLQITSIEDGKLICNIDSSSLSLVSKAAKLLENIENNITPNSNSKDGSTKAESTKDNSQNNTTSNNVSISENTSNNNTTNIVNKNNNSTLKNDSNTSEQNTTSNSKDSNKDSNNSTDSTDPTVANQDTMISIINNTIHILNSDPSYNYMPNVRKVLEMYNSMSQEDKAKFKARAYKEVDIATAKKIKDKLNIDVSSIVKWDAFKWLSGNKSMP